MQARLIYTIHDGQVFNDPEDAEKELGKQFEILKYRITIEGLTWYNAIQVKVLVGELEAIRHYTVKI